MITGRMKNRQPENSQLQIEQLIPHAGRMSLIERIDSWDNHCIQCSTDSHRQPDHPLRCNGNLSALQLLEYGAQCIAIHGGLLAGGSRPGFLAAIKNAHFYIEMLDNIQTQLTIRATSEIQHSNGAIYQFTVSAGQKLLLEAHATVMYSQS